MKKIRVRLLLGLWFCGVAAVSGFCAQGPKGAGADPNPGKVERVKKIKPEKPTPLYTIPRSLSWWQGGGPAPLGVGTK